MRYSSSILAISAATLTTALPQYQPYPGEPKDEAQQRANAVKEAFEFSWQGYSE